MDIPKSKFIDDWENLGTALSEAEPRVGGTARTLLSVMRARGLNFRGPRKS